MDPNFFNAQQQHWMNAALQQPAGAQAGWPTGMLPPWFQFPGMMQFPGAAGNPYGMTQQQQPLQLPFQHQEQSLTELKPAQQQQQLAVPPTPLNYLDMPNALPTPPPSGYASDAMTPPPMMFNGYNLAPPGRHTAVAEADSSQDGQTQLQQRGQKRKKAGGKEEDEERKEYNPMSPSSGVKQPKLVDVFCKVTGRLSVVGAQKTYEVSSDEIFRRTSLPENLNRSLLGPLLRRGKVKGCGDDLQKLLQQRGLTAQKVVNRKQHALNTLSSLLEEEAVQLSKDHHEIAFSKLPLVDIARLIIKDFRNPAELGAASAEAKLARTTMDSLLAVVQAWTDGGWTSGIDTILSSPMKDFALATHALGVEECRLFFSLFSRFLLVLDQECDAYMQRASAAYANNMHVMMANQFPPGLEPPEIKPGHLHVPDVDEQARGSNSLGDIPGRLTLQNKKYNVTVAEILRRVRAPESLNLSILGSLLKKGKTKDNGNSLRDDLSSQGINIDQGRRKSAKITLFTALLEDEALTLAKDLENEMKRTFPFGHMTEALVANASASTPMEIHASRHAFNATSRIAQSFEVAVDSLRLPVAERIPHTISNNAYLMLPYSSLTHGYGPDACATWIGCIRGLFEVAAQSLPMV